MAKFKPIEILQTLSGKVCSHSNIFFANKNTARSLGTSSTMNGYIL